MFRLKVSKFQKIFLLRNFCTSCWIEFPSARLLNFDNLSSLLFYYIYFYSFLSNPLHTVSFDWFLSGLEWILNLALCLLKLLIFYQKSLWIQSDLGFTLPHFKFLSLYLNKFDKILHFVCKKLQFWSTISKYRAKNSKCGRVKPRSDIP